MTENEIIIYVDKIRNYNLTQLKIELYKLDLLEHSTTKRKIVENIMKILQEDLKGE